MTATEWDSVAAAVQATVADFVEVQKIINSAIRERVPEYALVPDDQLNDAVDRNVNALLAALLERRDLSPSELHDFTKPSLCTQGIPARPRPRAQRPTTSSRRRPSITRAPA